MVLYNWSMIKANEEIFDLQCDGLKIIQDARGYSFTTDAVLLANTAKAYKNERVLELGTGSGVISLLLAKKTTAKEIVAVEIQERLADMASRSVKLNELEERVKVINVDMLELDLPRGSFDVVVTNPPYMKFTGDKETATEIDVCKREVCITLDGIAETAGNFLKYGGRMFAIVKTERAIDLICAMRANDIEPKVITPIMPTIDKNVDTVIIEGKKSATSGVVIKKPLIIANKDGTYTEEVERMYRNV